MKQLINEVGAPNLETEVQDDGTIEIKDTNTTYDKIKEQLPTFIEKYAGKDFKEIVEREADNVMMLKSEKKHSDDEALKSFSYKIKKKQNLKLTIKRFSTPPAFPWNGWHNDIEFTIDNMLSAFHFIQVENEDFSNFLKDSDVEAHRVLHAINECFNKKNWSEGKHVWVSQVLKLPMNDKVDLLGGEDIFFFNHVSQGQTTTFKSVCSENDCPEKVSLKVNYILSFSQPSNTVKNLEDGIKWLDSK